MPVLVRPYRVKGGTNHVNLDVYLKMRKKVIFSPPHFFFDYKNVALFVLGTVLPCLSASISHKHPILINSLFACIFASCWILSATRQKDLSFSKSWHQVRGFNQTTVGSSPLLVRDGGFKSQSEVQVGSSPSSWVWVPIWVLAGFKSHPRRSEVSATRHWCYSSLLLAKPYPMTLGKQVRTQPMAKYCH